MTTLKKLSDQVEQIVRTTPGAVDVENSLETSKPEVRIRIDREKASGLGVNVALIATSCRAMVDGYVATKYQEGDEQYDVRIRLNKLLAIPAVPVLQNQAWLREPHSHPAKLPASLPQNAALEWG